MARTVTVHYSFEVPPRSGPFSGYRWGTRGGRRTSRVRSVGLDHDEVCHHNLDLGKYYSGKDQGVYYELLRIERDGSVEVVSWTVSGCGGVTSMV